MSELPKGWAMSPIGELIELNPKNTAPDGVDAAFMPMNLLGKGYREQPTFQVKPWGDIAKSYVHFAEDDVLLAKITPCFENGKAGIAVNLPSGIGAGSSEYFVCRSTDNLLLPRWLLAYFKTEDFLQAGAQQMTGSVGHKRVPKGYLLNRALPLPPFPEQKRIADKLDTLLARVDACRDRLDQLPTTISRLRQSALSSAVDGRLTSDWRAANGRGRQEPEATALDDLLAAGWRFPRADEACSKVQSGGTPKEGFIASAGVPFLKVYNLVNQAVDFNYREQFIAEDVHRGPMRKSITKPGDVLMNIVGPPLGKVAMVPDSSLEWNINQAITLFRAGDELLGEWLYYVLCEGAAVRVVMPDTRGSVGQINISLSQCRAFTLPVPSLDEQKELVIRLRKLMGLADRLEERVRLASRAVGRLDKATLAKAFRGELVPQDPADEPAATMLARLAASESPQPNSKRVRGAA